MNPRQSRLGVPSVTHLGTALNLFLDCYMEEEGLEPRLFTDPRMIDSFIVERALPSSGNLPFVCIDKYGDPQNFFLYEPFRLTPRGRTLRTVMNLWLC